MIKPQKKIPVPGERHQDELTHYVMEKVDFFQQYGKHISIVLAVLIGGYFLIKLYNYQNEEENLAASMTLQQASEKIEAGDFEAAREEFERLADEYSGTDNGGRALYFLAVSQYNLGKDQEAAETYEKYLGKYGSDDLLVGYSLVGLGDCAGNQSKFEEAREFYRKALKIPELAFMSDRIDYKILLVEKELGNFKKVVDESETFLKEHKGSTLRENVEILKAFAVNKM